MRNTFTKSLLMAIVVSCFLLGCSKDEDAAPATPVTFLATGASFDYYYTSFFFEDTVKISVGEQIGKDTFLIRNSSEYVPVYPTQYWVLKGSTFYSSFRLRDPGSYVVECEFNKPKGTSWTAKKGSTTITYTIEELNATVLTGQGVVNDAVKIKMTAPGATPVYNYISPSVGPIGTGDFDNLSEGVRLCKYKTGTTAATTNVIPAITYGDFPFLKVGNYWKYNESSFFSDDDVVTLSVESKLSGKNIYKVLVSYLSGSSYYNYWYEDNGFLMTYEEGEEIVEADPIYMSEAIAEVGYGWAGLTESGQFFIYKIEELDQTVDTYFGSVSAIGINVTDGLFSSQTDYWNDTKGNVLVTGMVSRDVTESNAKLASVKIPFIPVIGF